MTKKEFIAELTTDLKQYDESNLIDYRSINSMINTKLKRFGNNIMVANDTFVRVVDGKAKLPESFWKLDLAVRCEPEGYNVRIGDSKAVISSYAYKIRTEEDLEWNNFIDSYVEKDYKQITETVYIDSNVVDFYYKSPIILKLTKGMNKEMCSSGCKNLQDMFTHSSPWEINIINNTLQANFDEGYVYIQYIGLPLDDEGEIIIPETQHNHLQEYLMYHCKARIVENLMGNGDEVNLINMYQIYSAKEREYFSLAMTETKFQGLGHDWDKKMKNKMRQTTLKYERLFPKR